MTYDECHKTLTSIRRRQGTRCPVVRIDYGGSIFQGRLSRCDSDPENRARTKVALGQIVLQDARAEDRPEVILAIAELPSGAIRDVESSDSTR